MDYQEDYTADGVEVIAQMQKHQIEPFALKIQDVSRGREALKIIDEPQDD
jgi:putative IMPACT (imprinted ancient) family translation regulator